MNIGRPRTPEPRLGLLASVDELRCGQSEPRENLTDDSGCRSSSRLLCKPLEHLLKAAEEELAAVLSSPRQEEATEPTVEPEVGSTVMEEMHCTSLVDIMAEWKKNVEGQWTSVREEWTEERERLGKAESSRSALPSRFWF